MKQVNQKLTTITRRDLTSGQQAVQSMHAAIDFCFEHEIAAKDWHTNSNYIAALSVDCERELIRIASKLEERGHRFTLFREPDLNNQVTAIACEWRDDLKKITGGLPLMLK